MIFVISLREQKHRTLTTSHSSTPFELRRINQIIEYMCVCVRKQPQQPQLQTQTNAKNDKTAATRYNCNAVAQDHRCSCAIHRLPTKPHPSAVESSSGTHEMFG
ncbi:hypothetical protein Y032_0129g1511 [Ancylostoma ceylanicum]|uniref:Uncharacterized protein n=1 Tax=Ancylostoma ceylanicum TaxID=53326 RepID=A0A016T7T7_9BILA|nr:hypothetical protein Y032_0129g1511 [Ancylostoma ceylanicum]